MSILDDQAASAALFNRARMNPATPEDFEPSVMGGVGRALFSIPGSLATRAGAALPLAFEPFRPQAQAVGDLLSVPAADWLTDWQEAGRRTVARGMPRPWELGTAGSLVYSLGVPVTEAVVANIFGGPAGAALYTGMTAHMQRSIELEREGVDRGMADFAALPAAVSQGASAFLPGMLGFGPTLGRRIATDMVGQGALNVGFGIPQRMAERDILAGEYAKVAEQIKPFGASELALDFAFGAVLSGAFHGADIGIRGSEAVRRDMGLPTVQAIISARDVMHSHVDTRPGDPRTPADAEAHVAAMRSATEALQLGEPVNVAGVVDMDGFDAATRAQEAAAERAILEAEVGAASAERLDTLSAKQPRDDIVIPEGEGLSPAARAIEGRLAGRVRGEFDRLVDEYRGRPDSEGGKVLNTDTARELSPDYLADRTQSSAVHEPASAFIGEFYRRRLAEAPAEGQRPLVMFTAGGTGAGKSSGIKGLPAVQSLKDAAQIVYDTNMNRYDSARAKLDQALAAGKEVAVVMTYREAVDALTGGALPRAMRQEAEFGSGRTVPLREHLKTHVGSREVILRLADEFAGDERVTFVVIDNSGGKGKQALVDLEFLRSKAHDESALRDQLRQALDREKDAGRISDSVYRGFLDGEQRGQASGRPDQDPAQAVRGPPGRGDRGEPSPADQRAGQALASAVYGADGEVLVGEDYRPFRWALVEAAKLVPDVTKTENQARDRTRKASEQQVALMAANLDFRRLGHSNGLNEGAPTLAPDGRIIGGNARTLAIQRAYEGSVASDYRARLEAAAAQFGLDPAIVAAMEAPALVRVLQGEVDVRKAAIASNEGGGLAMSLLEQAPVDAERLPPIDDFDVPENGDLNGPNNRAIIMGWIARFPGAEQAALVDANGVLSQEGMLRLKNAVLFKAYSDSPTLARMIEVADPGIKNVGNGLVKAGPTVATARESIARGNLHDVDLLPDLLAAVEKTAALRAEGMTLDKFMRQGEVFGPSLSPEALRVLAYIDQNMRSAKRIGDMVAAYYRRLETAGNPKEGDFFGGGVPTKGGLLEGAIRDVEAPADPTLGLFGGDDFPGTVQAPRSKAQAHYKANGRVHDAEAAPEALNAAATCEAA